MDGRGSLKRWERWTGHAGYVAEGVVYLLMGGFALLADVQRKRQPNGSQGALEELGRTPVGKALLALLALGLFAFVLWQMILAIVDPEHRPDRNTLLRWVVRLGHFCNGVFYCVLVGDAAWTLFGLGAAHDGDKPHGGWTSRVLQFPLGRYVVGMVGIGIVVFALTQFYRAVTKDKSKRVDLSRTPFGFLINALGVYGYVSRGVLFGLLGLYIFGAAWRFDLRDSSSVGSTLGALQQRPLGAWLLGVIAAGLMAYGLFQVLKERYRLFRDS